LLDWTLNAVAALYFATEFQAKKTDGGVFVYRRPIEVVEADDRIETCEVIKLYQPRPIDRRIIAQDSIFTVHPDPKKEMKWTPFKLKKEKNRPHEGVCEVLAFRVLFGDKIELQRQLRVIGVSRRSLFPDVEGLSVLINYSNALYNLTRQRSVNGKIA
jgi:hypothetical protein